jgi:hypothetical protein
MKYYSAIILKLIFPTVIVLSNQAIAQNTSQQNSCLVISIDEKNEDRISNIL